jgi:hypothetical protein
VGPYFDAISYHSYNPVPPVDRLERITRLAGKPVLDDSAGRGRLPEQSEPELSLGTAGLQAALGWLGAFVVAKRWGVGSRCDIRIAQGEQPA